MFLSIVMMPALQTSQSFEPPIPLMPRDEEISLAQQGGPTQVSKDATVYVLTREGFTKAREGTNGCVCLVNRWSAKDREPTCYSPKAVKTVLPRDLREMELRQQRKTEDDIAAELGREFLNGKLQPPEIGTVIYMMSRNAVVMNGDRAVTPPPHVMLSLPYAKNADIGISDPKGARQSGLPAISHPGSADAIIAFDMTAWLKEPAAQTSAEATILVQLKYWAKPGQVEALQRTLAEMEQAHVRAGSPPGAIFRGPGGEEADFIYEVQLPNAAAAKQIHQAIAQSTEISEIWGQTEKLISRFEDRVFVQRSPAGKPAPTVP